MKNEVDTREKIASRAIQSSSSNILNVVNNNDGGGMEVISQKTLKLQIAHPIDNQSISERHEGIKEELIVKDNINILQCLSVSIGLDPPHRSTRCAFCACRLMSLPTMADGGSSGSCIRNDNSKLCQNCGIIAICSSCRNAGLASWHVESGECRILSCLVRCYNLLFHPATSGDDCTSIQDGNHSNGSDNEDCVSSIVDCANEIDSTYVLTFRLMFRKWIDTRQQMEDFNGRLPPSPLPTVDWNLFNVLYTTDFVNDEKDTIPTQETQNYNSAIEALCHLMRQELNSNSFHSTQSVVSDAINHTNGGNHKKSDSIENSHNFIPNKNAKDELPEQTYASYSWLTKDSFDNILGKVLGCCHAITDVTLNLGCQCLGRALFLEQSFYNHSCAPNAFLSCHILDGDNISDVNVDSQKTTDLTDRQSNHCAAVMARVHCIRNIEKGQAVTLSYIPTSGLDRKERQERLRQGYQFICRCVACSISDHILNDGSNDAKQINVDDNKPVLNYKDLEIFLKVPEGGDVNVLRQIQYECNEKLLNLLSLREQGYSFETNSASDNISEDSDEAKSLREMTEIEANLKLKSCIQTLQMTVKGIQNQGIPTSHEVSIETHRLLATAFSLAGQIENAIVHHRLFLDAVEKIRDVFDPVALAISNLEFAADLEKVVMNSHTARCSTSDRLKIAFNCAKFALGSDHEFVLDIERKMQHSQERERTRAIKRLKTSRNND